MDKLIQDYTINPFIKFIDELLPKQLQTGYKEVSILTCCKFMEFNLWLFTINEPYSKFKCIRYIKKEVL